MSGIDLLDVAALAAVIVLAIASELALRRVARRPPGPHSPVGRRVGMTARHAQRLYERVLYVIAPPAVAAAIAVARGERVAIGLVIFGAMAVSSIALWPGRSPLNLMPVARTVCRFLLPAAGLAVALGPATLIEGGTLTAGDALAPLLGAWLIVAFGLWLEAAFDSDRPVRLAVIGSATLAKKLAAEMRQTKIRDYIVIGHIGEEPEAAPDVDRDHVLPWLGDLGEIRDIVEILGVDLLAVGPESPRLRVFEEAANSCLDLPVRMIEASALYEDVLGHVPIGQINSAWFQAIMHPRYSPTSPLSKRMLDLAIAIPTAIAAAPLIAVLALVIRITDGSPIFFRQRRVGEQGREFDIIKLRTMRPDAPELAGSVPREELVTPLGRTLRKTHLDELPQIWNVLKGEMTIVGPRPEQPQLVSQLAQVVPYYDRRSLVKPGVTGWAQVRCGYAGSQVGTAWKICHDLYYVKRRSVVLDLLIIIQTLHVLVERSSEDVEIEAPAEDFILGVASGLVVR